jgi:hypothetical protein
MPTTAFSLTGKNELVQKRLKIVLDAYRGGGFHSTRPEVFVALAGAAVGEIPPS